MFRVVHLFDKRRTKQSASQVGCMDEHCDVLSLLQEAYENAQDLAERHYTSLAPNAFPPMLVTASRGISLCAHPLRTLCVVPLSTPFAYTLCAHPLRTPFEHTLCAHHLSTPFAYTLCYPYEDTRGSLRGFLFIGFLYLPLFLHVILTCLPFLSTSVILASLSFLAHSFLHSSISKIF